MDFSTPGFPVLHHLPELAQTHVHWISDAILLSHPLSSPSLPAFDLSQHQGLFQWVSSSHEVAKVLELQLQHHSFSNHDPCYLPTGAEHFCLHKTLHTDIYGSFIHNCQNLEITNMAFSRWMDKWTVINLEKQLLFRTKKKWAIKPEKDMEKY